MIKTLYNFITIVTLISCFVASSSATGHIEKYALLIGITDYNETGFVSLDGPKNDLAIVKSVLLDRFGFKQKNITELMNNDSSHTLIKKAFLSYVGRLTKDDILYIHYSGHGSFTKDLNGDEEKRKDHNRIEKDGMDQTWVCSGSRQKIGGGDQIDQFDILDDEINEWVGALYEKTKNIILVSDSCHSESITRGNAPVSRALPVDHREHPLGRKKWKKSNLIESVMVGAARDMESASEIEFEDGNYYGLFTWYWVKALQETRSGETWNDIFKRARTLVLTSKDNSQHPQLSGNGNRLVFKGAFNPLTKSVPLIKVSAEGDRVCIKSGLLNGVTLNSIYQTHSPLKKGEKPGTFKITEVEADQSWGKVLSGSFQPGHLAVESQHVYPFKPIQVFLNSDFKKGIDQTLLKTLRNEINTISGFQVNSDQKKSDIVLYVLHPKKENNKYVFKSENETLPESFSTQTPELWVLTPGEKLINKKLVITLQDLQSDLACLKKNLIRLRQIKELKLLGTEGSAPAPIKVTAVKVQNVDSCDRQLNCTEIKGVGAYLRTEIPSIAKQTNTGFQKDTIFTFKLTNTSEADWYSYLIDISPTGEIIVIFPPPGAPEEEAQIKKGETLDLFEKGIALKLSDIGDETIKLITTAESIDASLLEQDGFRNKGSSRGAMNPLEKIINNVMQGTRGWGVTKADTWSATQFQIKVKK